VATPVHIRSRSNALLVRVRRLLDDPGAYRRHGQIVIEGEHLCAAWLASGRGPVAQAIVSEAGWERAELRRLAAPVAAVAIVPAAAMAGLASLESPAPILFLVPLPPASPLRPKAPSVVLDRLQDPGNVGSILRSAAAFGFEQAIAIKGTAALWSAKVVRAGMGAHFRLHLVEAAEPALLGEIAVPILGTSSHAGERVDQARLPWPCAWVFGHEGQGLSSEAQAVCANVLRIAQPGGEESLNVAAAAAVCLHESARRRPA
jgi:TrmH family RNA methyltransferase